MAFLPVVGSADNWGSVSEIATIKGQMDSVQLFSHCSAFLLGCCHRLERTRTSEAPKAVLSRQVGIPLHPISKVRVVVSAVVGRNVSSS